MRLHGLAGRGGEGKSVEEVAQEAIGHSGHVQVLGDRVRILRPGVMAGLSGNGDRELPFDQIQQVEFRDAGRHVNGWVRFVAKGDRPTPISTSHLVMDPYTVFFTYSQESDFKAVVAEVERRREARARLANGVVQEPPSSY